MRSSGKDIFEKDIKNISYSAVGKFKFNFKLELKSGKEIKLKRSIGKQLLKAQEA